MSILNHSPFIGICFVRLFEHDDRDREFKTSSSILNATLKTKDNHMTTVTAIANTTETTNSSSTQIITPKIIECVNAFNSASKRTVIAYLTQAETVIKARELLTTDEYKIFLREANLSESNAKKFCVIAKHKAVFAAHAETLPTNWTTLYKIATQDNVAISTAFDNKQITIDLTARKLAEISSFKFSNENKSAENKTTEIESPVASSDCSNDSGEVIKIDIAKVTNPQLRDHILMMLQTISKMCVSSENAFTYSSELSKHFESNTTIVANSIEQEQKIAA